MFSSDINFHRNTERSEFIYNNLDLDHCSSDEKEFIKHICNDFPYQFYIDGDVLGATTTTTHKIILKPDAKIVNVKQYNTPQTQREPMIKIVDEFERQGIVERCQSSWNSPAILISKKDDAGEKNDQRLVIDFRKLNECTEIQSFPIPLINNILNSFHGCKYFTILDIKGAFHQLFMDNDSKDYTAFTVGNRQYRWVRMPLGLATAPLTWQRAINELFEIYIDENIHFRKNKAKT